MLPEYDIPPPPLDQEIGIAYFENQNRAIQRKRVRKARWWLRLRQNIHKVIDGTFETFLTGYELPRNSRWTLFAQLFWIECPICFFYRGATFGFMLASFFAALVFLFIV